MGDTVDFTRFLVAIAGLDYVAAVELLNVSPSLATAKLARADEFFLAERLAEVYEGDTALHAAAFSYDRELARELITRGADIRAKNRRGAEPLHAAVIGVPGTASWNPTRQCVVIAYLIEAGADPDAAAAGGVTPLHRAVRNRCSAAVDALLRAGADPRLRNDGGSTASDLAHWTTGRGGTGSAEAKAEQKIILELLKINIAVRDDLDPLAIVHCPRSSSRAHSCQSADFGTVALMATIRRVAPIFPVRDLYTSFGHYQRLGFNTREYEGGGYGFVTRDGVEIHLGVVSDVQRESAQHSAYLWVDDADALAETWRAAGAEVHMPEDTEWGQHEGALVDPDGNVLRFGSPIN